MQGGLITERLFSKKALAKLRNFNRFDVSLQLERYVEILWFQLYSSELTRKIKPNLNMHRHTFYEIHFVLEGSVSYITSDGEEFLAGKGEYICIPPKSEHQRKFESDTLKKAVLAFSVLDEAGKEYSFPEKICVADATEWYENIFSILAIALESDNGITSQLVGNVLSAMILLIAEKIKVNIGENAIVKKDERLIKAKRFIADNSFRNVSVAEAADFVYLSVKQIERLFAEQEHMNVSDYIAKARCAAAKAMLARDEFTIAEVAQRLDFSNIYNFTRFFKRVEGITPGAYKKIKSKQEDGSYA